MVDLLREENARCHGEDSCLCVVEEQQRVGDRFAVRYCCKLAYQVTIEGVVNPSGNLYHVFVRVSLEPLIFCDPVVYLIAGYRRSSGISVLATCRDYSLLGFPELGICFRNSRGYSFDLKSERNSPFLIE